MKNWITEGGQKIDLQELTREKIQHTISSIDRNIRIGAYTHVKVKRAKLFIKTLERELMRRKVKYTPLRKRLETLL